MFARDAEETQRATSASASPGMDAAVLKGMAIVTLAEAARIGRVDEVLFETEPLRAAALLTRDDHQEHVIAMSAIRRIGTDAIVIDDVETARERAPSDPDLRGLEALTNLKVVDETGSYLGRISRIDVDPDSGDVTGLELRKGEVLGVGGETMTLDRDAVMGVGSDLVTVRQQP